ncbi:MAG TPA: hypothetical protein VFG03_08735, partial [Telluria sp.]|nr:hypothetical protein [Telluria sp.]
FSNGSGGAQVGAHGHDNGALLGSQMFVNSRHGGTLQEKVLHLVFENAPLLLKPAVTPPARRRNGQSAGNPKAEFFWRNYK